MTQPARLGNYDIVGVLGAAARWASDDYSPNRSNTGW